MQQDDRQDAELHPSLRPVLRLELAQHSGQPIAPLGPEYYMWAQALHRQVQVFVNGSPPGTSC